MEECKRMGIKVLGPDVNESQKGFAVNRKGEIRFGLGGLKGVGEAAVESLIEEREKNGSFPTVFDMVKRVNQRTVNKKTLESLAYAGAFDCFTEIIRAQYFNIAAGENVNGLEKIIRYGQVCQNQSQHSVNTLFGDLSETMEVQVPKIPACEPWPLVVQLDYEKEVTGIFLSGHPLDDYRFEMEHYGIAKIAFLNEYREEKEKVSSNAIFKIMGLVSDAQHRIAKSGNKFGTFVVEDYSGKMELVLFSEDYMRYSFILQLGATVYITGFFKQRYNGDFEFKIISVSLAESVRKNLTKKLMINLPATDVTEDMIRFVQQNLKSNKGSTTLLIGITDPADDLQVDLFTGGKGFEMNAEMIEYLGSQPNWNVKVEC